MLIIIILYILIVIVIVAVEIVENNKMNQGKRLNFKIDIPQKNKIVHIN